MAVVEERVSDLERQMERLAYEQMKTEIQMQKLSAEMQKLSSEMRDFKKEMKAFKDQTNKVWGDLANKLGTVVQNIIAPNLKGVARTYFKVDRFADFAVRRHKQNVRDPQKEREFDVIAQTDRLFFIDETKTTPRVDDAREFVDLLASLADYFPESADMTVVAIFSSMAVPKNVEAILTAHNVYCMVTGEDNMILTNFDQVRRDTPST